MDTTVNLVGMKENYKYHNNEFQGCLTPTVKGV